MPPMTPARQTPATPQPPLHTVSELGNFSSGMPTHGKKRKPLLYIAIIVIVLGIAGGGYFAYAKGYMTIPFLSPKGDTMFTKMVSSLSSIKNAQYSIQMKIMAEPRTAGATPLFPVNTNTATNGNDNINAGNANANITLGLTEPGLATTLLGTTDPEDIFQSFPSDVQLTAGTTLYIEAEKTADEANASISFDGTYTGGDATFAASLEARKIGKDVYAVMHKFPSILFFDFSALKDKWVAITSDDASSPLATDTFSRIQSQQFLDQAKTALETAMQKGFLSVGNKLSAETIAGVRSDHYRVSIHPERLRDVYQALLDAKKAKGEKTDEIESALTMVNEPKTSELLARLAANSTYDVWIDRTRGMLRQSKWSLTIVPPEKIERLKGKQFRLELQLTLDKVNQHVTVQKPSPTISFDEASRLLTGISKDEQQFEKQTSQIAKLRSVLQSYKTGFGTYPDSLAKLSDGFTVLKQKCGDGQKNSNAQHNTNTTPETGLSSYDCLTYAEYTKKLPSTTDIYTTKQYAYAKSGDDFTLAYQIHYFDDMSSYDKDEYADGKNIMTSKDYSLEKQSRYETILTNTKVNVPQTNTPASLPPVTNSSPNKSNVVGNVNTSLGTTNIPLEASDDTTDSDGDGLSDTDEQVVYGTNPQRADTDNDGYNDGTEVRSSYNPLGAGKATQEQLDQWNTP